MEELTLFTAKTSDDVIYCLQRGDNINLMVQGTTPFLYHCRNNNIEVVLSLIDHNCDVTLRPLYGQSGLELVCQLGHSNLLREMLQYANVCALVNPINSPITTPLMHACIKGHTDIFDILVEHKANINLPNMYGSSPLMTACLHSNEDIVKSLLQLGVNVNQRDVRGQIAIFSCKNVNILHLLYIYGADINIQDNDGNTPLFKLITENDVADAFLKLGPNLNIRNNIGRTVLISAADSGNSKIVRKLLRVNADINIIDNYGKKAYNYIVHNNHLFDGEREQLIFIFKEYIYYNMM